MDIALICVVSLVYKRASFYGQAFWSGIAGYGVVRFITEFFRECDSAPVGFISLAQWASLAFMVIGLLGAFGRFGRQPIEIPGADTEQGKSGRAADLPKR